MQIIFIQFCHSKNLWCIWLYVLNGWILATVSAWKNSVSATIGSVRILIGPRALKSLNSIERIQPRMMVATFNGNPRATIISCYSPTNVSKETELIAFYDELSYLVRSHSKTQCSRHWRTQNGKMETNAAYTTSNRFHDKK